MDSVSSDTDLMSVVPEAGIVAGPGPSGVGRAPGAQRLGLRRLAVLGDLHGDAGPVGALQGDDVVVAPGLLVCA